MNLIDARTHPFLYGRRFGWHLVCRKIYVFFLSISDEVYFTMENVENLTLIFLSEGKMEIDGTLQFSGRKHKWHENVNQTISWT